jgi:hypothetical protein
MAAPSATDIDAIVASSSSMMSHSTSQVDVGDSRRIRLRLAFGGSFIAVSAAARARGRRRLCNNGFLPALAWACLEWPWVLPAGHEITTAALEDEASSWGKARGGMRVDDDR